MARGPVDYDQVSSSYDTRYQRNTYAGVEDGLVAFAGERPIEVLEVGCGTGHWLRLLDGRRHTVTGADRSRGMLDKARSACPEVALVWCCAEALPFAAARFDRVYCVNAFHHFPDKRAFLREARRVLRPGGGLWTVGIDPHTDRDRWSLYDYFEPTLRLDRERYPATEQIRRWLEDAGFTACRSYVTQHTQLRQTAAELVSSGHLHKDVTSQLSILSDAEFEAGLARLRADIEAARRAGTALEFVSDLSLWATEARC